jgi:hypothetical protein
MMILLTQKSALIQHNTVQLYSYLSNMENYGQWFPGVVNIQSANKQRHATIGKRYSETLIMPEGDVTLTIEVKQASTNTLFYTEGDLKPVFPAMKMEFQDLGAAGTQFSLSYYSRNPELSDSHAMIKALRADLSLRIGQAMSKLQLKFNGLQQSAHT